jgi:FkbM family methyltransferase
VNDYSETMLKAHIKGLARYFGYEIVGLPRAYAAERSVAGLLRQEQINLVVDVGANTGQFVGDLRQAGYKDRIVSFEPLASAHSILQTRAAADSNWTIADRTAIGSETGTIDIHVSGNSVSSSILQLLPTHSEADRQSSYVGIETVPIKRLDDLISLATTDRVLLKVDVQGYEKQVLDGACNLLKNCRAIICEMSLVPLYGGQLLARDMWDLLVAQDFEPWSLEPCFRHPQSGRMLQLDGVFVRSSHNGQNQSRQEPV